MADNDAGATFGRMRLQELSRATGDLLTRLYARARPLVGSRWSQFRPYLQMVRPFGWVVLATAFLSWLFGVWLGWLELVTLAAICGALTFLCILFLFGRQTLDISLEIVPGRVVVGERAAGQLTVANHSESHLLATKVEVVVGSAVATFDIPSLGPDADHEELFQISTERRGVIPVGPARLVRADPLGLFARVVRQSESVNLYVHPVTLRVPGVGPGFLRDLEGLESAELSPSDLAFHSLREYVPGDDRRHVHWKTSARSGRLMVQQFVDTRRSHVVVLLDDAASRYPAPDQFELAVSVTGSLAIRAITDDQIRTVAVGIRPLPTTTPNGLLDALSGVACAGPDDALERCVAVTSRSARNASIVLLVTGPTASVADIRRMARRFTVDVRVVAIRVGMTDPEVQRMKNVLVLNIGELDDLPRITNMAVSL
jgi:uncharacterized protein (DUF58 family)